MRPPNPTPPILFVPLSSPFQLSAHWATPLTTRGNLISRTPLPHHSHRALFCLHLHVHSWPGLQVWTRIIWSWQSPPHSGIGREKETSLSWQAVSYRLQPSGAQITQPVTGVTSKARRLVSDVARLPIAYQVAISPAHKSPGANRDLP